MKLTKKEFNWIAKRMGTYKIRFQEIYNEMLDHVISSVEDARTAGDDQPVEVLFEQIVDKQFGGATGIEKLSRSQERLYGLKIHNMVWQNYRTGFIWKTLACIAVTLLLGFILPENLVITSSIYAAILVVILSLRICVVIRMREVKAISNKRSLTKSYLLFEAFIPVILLGLVFNVSNIIQGISHHQVGFFLKNHPGIAIYLLCYTVLYTQSCYRVFNHELTLMKR